jgi:hypothetical protein
MGLYVGGVIEWGKVPWTLWAHVFLALAGLAIPFALRSGSKPGFFALGVAFVVVWNYFLLRRVRWLWIVTVAFAVIGEVQFLALGPRNYGLGIGLASIVFLLHPLTRDFFAKRVDAAS